MSVPGIPHVYFLLETLTCIHIATVNLLNAFCSEIPFNQPGRLNIFTTLFTREKQEFFLISRS